jgi:hypothetical protein
VTSYAGLIIEDSVKILQSGNLADEESITLRKRVIIALHKAFEHDQDGRYLKRQQATWDKLTMD